MYPQLLYYNISYYSPTLKTSCTVYFFIKCSLKNILNFLLTKVSNIDTYIISSPVKEKCIIISSRVIVMMISVVYIYIYIGYSYCNNYDINYFSHQIDTLRFYCLLSPCHHTRTKFIVHDLQLGSSIADSL